MTEFDATASASGPGAGLWSLLDSMGPDARERPRPKLTESVAGVGGAVIAAGLTVAAAESRSGVVAVSVLLLITATGIRFGARVQRELRAAAVGTAIVAIPAAAMAVTGDSFGDTTAAGWLLAGAMFVIAWLLPGFRGRTLLLGLGALSLVSGAASLGGSAADECAQYFVDGPTGVEPTPSPDDCVRTSPQPWLVPRGVVDALGVRSTVSLLGGAVLLGLARVLDRRGYRGTATGLAAAALASTVIGAILLWVDVGDTAGTILVAIVGMALCLVGAHGQRRATTWWGAGLGALGTVATLVVQIEPTSPGATGAAFMIGGLLLVAAPAVVRTLRTGRAAGPERAVPDGGVPMD